MTRQQDRSKALQIIALIAPPVLMALTGLLLRRPRSESKVARKKEAPDGRATRAG